MNSIRFSLLLLAAVIFFCVWNCVHMDHLLIELTKAAERIDPLAQMRTQTEHYQRLCALWEKAFPYLSYVANLTELNRADEAVQALLAAYTSGSRENAAAAKAHLCDALRRIRELESVSFRAVF